MPDMRWSSASDEALLRATPVDPDAFAELYDRYESALVGYLLRRTGNIEVAVDLASEVFATALGAAHPACLTARSPAGSHRAPAQARSCRTT
jgi:DNA-directed RNA polymerase specialized sigma24 family protein